MLDYPVGREPIQLVEILQPLCSRTFGVAPCTATGTADTKCYNTRATCQDTANYALGTPLSLWFANAQVLPTLQANQRVGGIDPSDWILTDGTWSDAGVWYDPAFWKDTAATVSRAQFDPVNGTYPNYIFPSLVSVSTSPTRANLAGANSDANGIGNRALCTIRLMDFQHTDRLVDPYVSGRSWDPLSADRGSFWARWLVRNKYRTNIQVKIYEGYAGQDLDQMSVRLYFISGISKQNSAGEITIECKDVLARIEERQAQAPTLSPGVLYTDIDASAITFEVANAVEADYATSGTLRIGDELMKYTGRATSANGITFTGVTRATDSTTAEEHSVDEAVQQCIRYSGATVEDTLVDLLETRGGIPAAYMTDLKSGGTSYEEIVAFLSGIRLNRVLTEPYSISGLVADMAEQFQFILWWEETEQLIKARVIKGYDELPDTLTEESNILSGSFAMKDLPRQRASQVWVYYLQRDYTASDTEPTNYAEQYVIANLESETDNLYGTPSIRTIFGGWISQSIAATNTATRISRRYNELPTQAMLRVDIKDGSYQIGDTFQISHHLDVDQYGARRQRIWMVSSREEVVPNEIVEYVVEDTTLYGRIYYVMAAGSADYNPASVPFKSGYIGDASGVLSDGSTAARMG